MLVTGSIVKGRISRLSGGEIPAFLRALVAVDIDCFHAPAWVGGGGDGSTGGAIGAVLSTG